MDGKEAALPAHLKTLAKVRLRELRAMTKITARELGLPPAAEPAVLATLFGDPVGFGARVPTAIPLASTADETDNVLRNRLRRVVEGFFRISEPDKIGHFQEIWNTLQVVPFATIVQGLGTPRVASSSVGFASTDRTLGAVISTVGWFLANDMAAAGVNKEAVATEAQSRGCSRSASYALAEYLVSLREGG